jgi:hypothetical protein
LLVAGHGAQPLDVVDQMPGRVRLERGIGSRAAAAALVEKQDVVARRIELAAMIGIAAAAGAAMEEDCGLSARRPAPLPIELVAVADGKPAGRKRLDRWIEGAALAQKLSSS